MGGIIDTLIKSSKKLKATRYQSHKFCYDSANNSVIEYDIDQEVVWKLYGESDHIKKPKDLTSLVEQLHESQQPSWFKYFLDGSRHTYKVDDIAFHNRVYPILAGQIGVSCCNRIDKKMGNEFFIRKWVVVLPNSAIVSAFHKEDEVKKLCVKLNQSSSIAKLASKGLQIDDVLLYDLDKDGKFEKKGIAKIQDYMIEEEKKAVLKLVKEGKVNDEAYLIKDGSLEYKATSNKHMDLTDAKIKNAYQYVIGVSKSFNPTMCKTKDNTTNSSIIAGLKPNERTPACCYESKISGAGVSFCVWYLRLRDSKYTQNVFDGVIKVEKLIQHDEEAEGVSSELVDTISAYLLMERNPVAYGKDGRWANHLYPVFVTENFAKSKYISTDTFLNLF